MRWRRRRLTSTDLLNIHVALSLQIDQCVTRVREATSQPIVEAWSREAASYIATHRRVTARSRSRTGVADQSSRWAADLCAAITAAVARVDSK